MGSVSIGMCPSFWEPSGEEDEVCGLLSNADLNRKD